MGMDVGPSLGECMAELPGVAQRASEGVLELYVAVRQAKALGASYNELVAATGMARSTVRDVVAGKVPGFAVGG